MMGGMSDPNPPAAFAVPAEQDGARLDRALVELVPGASRVQVQGWIKDGGVAVDGAPVLRPAHAIAAGQTIELTRVPSSRTRPGAPADLDFRLVHTDEHILVVEKPAGMVVHPSNTVRGGTLSELCEARYGPLPTPQGEERHGIVHRLDAETSGLCVLARTEEAGDELKRQFKAREVDKLYLAIVHGDPRFDADWIESPLGRSPKSPDRVSVMPEDEGRPSRTFYEVRERFGCAALLACKPVTGRTHQIRVHLESIEHPVVGDKLYKGRRGRREHLPADAPKLERHALHATHLAFTHPASGAPMAFDAPLPDALEELCAWLRARASD